VALANETRKRVSARARAAKKTDQGYFQLCILYQLPGLAYWLLRALTLTESLTILTQSN